jgi:antirestriction protein ArdC
MDYRDEVMEKLTERIIADLEAGTCPWEKPWFTRNIPVNAKTERTYKGSNILLLAYEKERKGYRSNLWATFKQVQALGGWVKPKAHGTKVVFYEPIIVPENETKDDIEKKTFFLLRSYNVFNLDQTTGIEHLKDKQVRKTVFEQNIEAERILVESGARIEFEDRDTAYYNPYEDKIGVPFRDLFNDPSGFYGTVFHEITHWTGHESRLNRQFKHRFGDEAYAFEELVAEIGGAFLCSQVGYQYHNQHSSYIASWLKVLRNDKRAVFSAAAKAQSAVDFIVKKQFEEAVA